MTNVTSKIREMQQKTNQGVILEVIYKFQTQDNKPEREMHLT